VFQAWISERGELTAIVQPGEELGPDVGFCMARQPVRIAKRLAAQG